MTRLRNIDKINQSKNKKMLSKSLEFTKHDIL